ncbi:magnesium chelatase domain-containing protein [Streptomyces sp. NPDC001750]|uniref:magnesium chelatase domain-containing protein n=1 Tax=Streptomyces sp. NPDC001750 TaxID=3364607 RepID=UPI003692A1C2
MTETLHTDPATAAHSKAFEDAYQAASVARRTLYSHAVAYAAHLVRTHLPEAAALTVRVQGKELHEVLDANGNTLWHAPSAAGHGLSDGIADEVDGLLSDAISFGSLAGAAGWRIAPQGLPFRTVRLPEPPEPEATSHEALAVTQTARSSFPTLEGLVEVHAELAPGENTFTLTGPNLEYVRETRDRIRAAVINAGYRLPDGALTVTADGPPVTPAAAIDLPLAVTVLAAVGAISGKALPEKVALIGELGLDGRVRPVGDINEAIRTAYANGYHTAVVSEPDLDNVDVAGIGIYGAKDLRQVLALLKAIASKK